MLASTPTVGMAQANLAFTLIVKSIQQAKATSQPVATEQGNHSATPLASSQTLHHIDVKA